MSVRTEQTLRRMWDESLKLATDSNRLADEATASAAEADAAAKTLAALRTAEKNVRTVSNNMMAEAADLADLVNRERQDAGLAPLNPGDPYPVDPSPDTITDGLDTRGEVAQP